MRFIILSMGFFFSLSVLGLPTTFPEILEWKKSPIIELENQKVAVLKKNGQLKNAFVVVTANEDEVILKFSGGEVVTIMPRSKVQVPQVSPESGDVGELFIHDGTIRYKAGLESSKLRVKSAFFDLKIPAGVDLFLAVIKKQPSTKLQVISGEMTAQFLDFEKTQKLKAGDGVLFVGEFDGENIKYDFLLNSRKAPHGVLGPLEKFDFESFTRAEKIKHDEVKKKLEAKKKAELIRQKKQKAYEDSFLCREPFGQRDQCYWQIEKEQCFRFRCKQHLAYLRVNAIGADH